MAKKDEIRKQKAAAKEKMVKIITWISIVLVVVAVIGLVVLVYNNKNKKKDKQEKKVSSSCVVKNYKGLELAKMNTKVTPSDYEVYYNALLEQLPNYIEDETKADAVIKKDDAVNIDFDGKVDGEAFDGGSGKNFDLLIGSGKMIEGFEEGLVGKKVGEEFEVKVLIPLNYWYHPELSGKVATFTVKVNYMCKVSNELSDEYFKRNTKYKSKQEYEKEYLENYLKEQKEATADKLLKDQTLSILFDNTEFKNLDQDVEAYYNQLLDYYTGIAKQNGKSLEDYVNYFNKETTYEVFIKKLHNNAENGIKQSLVLQYIAKKEKLEVTDEIYNKYIDQVVEENNCGTIEGLKNSYSDEKINEMILIVYALDKVYSYATITEATE